MAISTRIGRQSRLHVVIRSVSPLQPLAWLSRGWSDLRQPGHTSLAYGALLAATGWVLVLLGSTHPYFIAAAVSGFLLVGPLMTTGVCELSRRLETRESRSFDDSLEGYTRNHAALLEFGLILAAISIAWLVTSELLLRSFLQSRPPDLNDVLYGSFLHSASGAALVPYLLIGGLLAAIAFTLSAVSIPLILDQHASATEAMRASIRVVFSNLPAMFVWGALLVGLVALGFATLLVGMIWIAPLLGHATWHAYRDLIEH